MSPRRYALHLNSPSWGLPPLTPSRPRRWRAVPERRRLTMPAASGPEACPHGPPRRPRSAWATSASSAVSAQCVECVAVVVGVADWYSRRGQGPGDVGSSSGGGGRSHDARRIKAGGRRSPERDRSGAVLISTRARTRYRARTRGEASVSARMKLGRFADPQGRLSPPSLRARRPQSMDARPDLRARRDQSQGGHGVPPQVPPFAIGRDFRRGQGALGCGPTPRSHVR